MTGKVDGTEGWVTGNMAEPFIVVIQWNYTTTSIIYTHRGNAVL